MSGSNDELGGRGFGAFLAGNADEDQRRRFAAWIEEVVERQAAEEPCERPRLTGLLNAAVAARTLKRTDAVEKASSEGGDAAAEGRESQLGDIGQVASVSGRRAARRFSLQQWMMVAAAVAILVVLGALWVQTWDGGGRVAAVLDDPFGRVTRTAGGEVRGLEGFPEQWREAIGEMVRREAVTVPEGKIEALRGNRGTGPSMYLRPVATVVRSDRPTFEWRSRGEDAKYRVAVYSTEGLAAVTESEDVEGLRWDSTAALRRGETYAWQVWVLRDGKTLRPSEHAPQFKILDAASLAVLEKEEQAAKGSHLVRAVLYLKAGLLDDAERELESLKAQGASALVEKLLESLGKQR